MSKTITGVLAGGMCAGCGLCVSKPDEMQFDSAGFLRPKEFSSDNAIDASCPGHQVFHLNREASYETTWGPILSSSIGYSTDPKLRYKASSGGALSAVLCWLLERGHCDAVIQTGADPEQPMQNRTKILTTPLEVSENAGSRYAPSSPLSIIRMIENDPRRFAFVGKPCDIAALRKLISLRPELQSRFVSLISFFCAGVPSQKGTEALLNRLRIPAKDVATFQYRGNGWPGMTRAVSNEGRIYELTYNEAWGRVLNKHLQARCKICADGSGEAADIVCADAWHSSENGYPSFDEGDGRSLVLARTTQGKAKLDAAVNDGYLSLEPYDINNLAQIQPYQENRKQSIISRQLALAVTFGRPPRFREHHLLKNAVNAGSLKFVKSFIGTLLRRLKSQV